MWMGCGDLVVITSYNTSTPMTYFYAEFWENVELHPTLTVSHAASSLG